MVLLATIYQMPNIASLMTISDAAAVEKFMGYQIQVGMGAATGHPAAKSLWEVGMNLYTSNRA